MKKVTLGGIVSAALLALIFGCGSGDSSGNSEDPNKPSVESIVVNSNFNGEAGLYNGVDGTVSVSVHDPDGSVDSAEASVNSSPYNPLSGPVDGPFTGPVNMSGTSGTIDVKIYDNEGKQGTGTTSVDLLANEVQGDNAVYNQIQDWKANNDIVDGWINHKIELSDLSEITVDGAIVENDFTYGAIEYQGENQTPSSVDNMETRLNADNIGLMKIYSDPLAVVESALDSKDPSTIKKIGQNKLSNGALETVVYKGSDVYERIVIFKDYVLGIETYENGIRTNVEIYNVVTEGGTILECVQGENPRFKVIDSY